MKSPLLFFSPVLFFLFSIPSRAAEESHRIGVLTPDDQFLAATDGFKMQMSSLGYREGMNAAYLFYNAKGNRNALDRAVRELIELQPDLIVTSSTTATFPVAKAAQAMNLPVVFLTSGNPLKSVESYSSSETIGVKIPKEAFLRADQLLR